MEPGTPVEEIQKARLYRKIQRDNAIAPENNAVAPELETVHAPERHWLWIAATVVMIALVGGVWRYQDGHQETNGYAQAKLGPIFKGRNFIHLPDGSTVLLNAGSELSYAFGIHGREVMLRGEAFFDVVHNPRVPFIVHSGKVNTRVLGTSFNVRAYPGHRNIKVTVSRGEVQVGDAQRSYGSIRTNEEFVVDNYQNTVEKNTLNAKQALMWHHSFLILDDLSMGQVARILSRKYQVTIVFENKALENCRINAKFFADEKLEEVLSIMGLVLQFEYEHTDPAHITIRGKGCN
jgi:ferric-dicitrate binding protein FerR (iron transport regulator)